MVVRVGVDAVDDVLTVLEGVTTGPPLGPARYQFSTGSPKHSPTVTAW
jgi:hypothetical protein